MDDNDTLSPSPAHRNSNLTTKISLTLIQFQGMYQAFRCSSRIWVDHIYPYHVTTYMAMVRMARIDLRI